MVNKLRRLAIRIIEDMEDHIDRRNNSEEKPKPPFENEEWYEIEDEIYERLHDYLVGQEEDEEPHEYLIRQEEERGKRENVTK